MLIFVDIGKLPIELDENGEDRMNGDVVGSVHEGKR